MPALGHNPLVAIQIALVGHAADTVEQPLWPDINRRLSSYHERGIDRPLLGAS